MFLHEQGEGLAKRLKHVGIEPIAVLPFLLVVLIWILFAYDARMGFTVFSVLLALLPFYLPLLLLYHGWIAWIHYIRFKFWLSQEHILLELEVPQEVEKSPLAMELFLIALNNAGGETTFLDRMWLGKFRAVWSLEIASNEGKVNFYIHLRKQFKNVVEARMYGQFPEVKMREVPDYARAVPFNTDEYSLFAAEYQFGKPDAYPIKTYVDYKLDKDPDTEYKVDPISNILELLGQVGPGEYYWMQIICVARKKDQFYGFYSGKNSLEEGMKAEIQAVMTKAAKRAQKVITESDVTEGKLALLTEGEKRAIEALERSFTKLIFECGIRVMYLGRKENFKGINNGQVIRFFDSFKSPEFNSIGATRGHADFDYPWQDFKGILNRKVMREYYQWYCDRAYFYVPYDQVPMMMTVEELATLWHFPGSNVKTPSLSRAATRTAEAPANLPV